MEFVLMDFSEFFDRLRTLIFEFFDKIRKLVARLTQEFNDYVNYVVYRGYKSNTARRHAGLRPISFKLTARGRKLSKFEMFLILIKRRSDVQCQG